jgi:indolepyruvate ferredoxin oxidoreductase
MELDIQDKYLKEKGTVFLTGIEALVRLIMDKQRADLAGGHVNQTFLSGYEGSPLGGLDLKIVEQLDLLNRLGRTVHQFGINEKTAASAMLGTQYAASGDVDAFWYGKAHGTMWIPDEVWLANLAGTGARGSMVLLCGEDHRSKSSVSPGSSDWVLRSSLAPIFYPAGVQDILRLGRHAVAMSRYCGLVTALKLVTPVCDGASTVCVGQNLYPLRLPETAADKRFNPIVMATGALPMQRQLVEHKIPLAEEYIRLNQLNRIVDADAGGDVGIVATGKSYTDVRQALDYMGIKVPILHLSVTYPLEKQIVHAFGKGLKRVYIVEEPGPFIEDAVKAALWGSDVEEIYGQLDEKGAPFIPSYSEVDPELLARLLWPRLQHQSRVPGFSIKDLDAVLERDYPHIPKVSPQSCGGCPYNSFRALKEKPGGAIGCSSIRAVDAYDNGVLYIPTMGAGGSIYSGWAAFNGNQHIFQYLGDGSYFHSGRGAIQSCVQAGTNITYLLLYNGAVALTGGQQPGGQQPVAEVAREVLALGVKKVGIVSAEPEQYHGLEPSQVQVYDLEGHGEALDHFKGIAGTTVIILDKECATEKGRRRRRQGLKPEHYVLIDEQVCEGCGDCYDQSEGCAALYPVQTEFGEKTQVRQANCSQDGLCVDGECPSFLSVEPAKGVGLRRRQPDALEELPEPDKVPLEKQYTILAVGRGGTGVVTISHLLAYAAMIEGKQVYLANNTGLAQKGGPVESPIVIGSGIQPVFNRLFPSQVDLYLGFDLLRAAETEHLKYLSPERSTALVSTSQVPSADMNRHRDLHFPEADRLQELIDRYSRKDANIYLDSYWLAERLFGDIIYANMILLGASYQAGAVPLESASMEAAIRLNGKAVENNMQAFRWGRLAVADPGRVEETLGGKTPSAETQITTHREQLANKPKQVALYDQGMAAIGLDGEGQAQLGLRLVELCAYQDQHYARRYLDLVQRVWQADAAMTDRGGQLTRLVSTQFYKLMAYKDEYEVARLLTRPEAEDRVRRLFDGQIKIKYRLHPPTMRWMNWGKLSLGPWFRPLLKLLPKFRGLRGTWMDPFGRSACRRLERELVDWYQDAIEQVVDGLRDDTYGLALEIAAAPDKIRGYEDVKIRSAAPVREQVRIAMQRLQAKLEARAEGGEGKDG